MSHVVESDEEVAGPERGRLGFARVAVQEFGFLLKFGFELVEVSDTLARYQNDRRVVRVSHERGSYELGVAVGRWVDIDGVRREQAFPLQDLVALQRNPSEVGYGGTSATTAESVSKFLRQLAMWTREFAAPLLRNGDVWFERLSHENAVRAEAERDGFRASQLRSRAQDAWQRREFGAVVNAYSEIDRELLAVELRPSERGRLDYALRELDKSE